MTQTISSDSTESLNLTVVQKKPSPKEDPKNDINITVSKSFINNSGEQFSDLVRSQTPEVNKMDVQETEPMGTSSMQELSRLIAIMTHIGPIGQAEPLVATTTQTSPPPTDEPLIDLPPPDRGLMLGASLPSRQPSPTWPSAEEATSSWFDDIVASHAADNSLILAPVPVRHGANEEGQNKSKIT